MEIFFHASRCTKSTSIHTLNATNIFSQSENQPLELHGNQRLVSKDLLGLSNEELACLAQKGYVYLRDAIYPAFEGRSDYPTPVWGGGNIEEILERQSWRGFVSHDDPIPKQYEAAFRMTRDGISAASPTIMLIQALEYENRYGKHKPTNAQYQFQLIPSTGAIITLSSGGPIYKMFEENPRPSEDEVLKRLPQLHRLSDALWIVWELFGKGKLETLRYYVVNDIRISDETGQLIYKILKDRRRSREATWDQRVTFDIVSKEALALLGSPSGLALAWLLTHHATVLGWRRPVVTIFNENYKFCMIWDLVPEGEHHTFGDIEPPVYCNAENPPAYCETPDADMPEWLEWLSEAIHYPAPGQPASSPPPTSAPPLHPPPYSPSIRSQPTLPPHSAT
ncbi:MAG: hypothetical protein Q9224_005493 [Gallowayella concinna]